MDTFDPIDFAFTRLQGFSFPGDVAVYEYASRPSVDGNPNFLRINVYLSTDGDFITVWRGLLEPLSAPSKLGDVRLPDEFDFARSYTEDLFRGYIQTAEAARHILGALRLKSVLPQVLSAGADGGLRCDAME